MGIEVVKSNLTLRPDQRIHMPSFPELSTNWTGNWRRQMKGQGLQSMQVASVSGTMPELPELEEIGSLGVAESAELVIWIIVGLLLVVIALIACYCCFCTSCAIACCGLHKTPVKTSLDSKAAPNKIYTDKDPEKIFSPPPKRKAKAPRPLSINPHMGLNSVRFDRAGDQVMIENLTATAPC